MAAGTPKVWIRKRRTNGGISYSLRWRKDGRMRSESLGRIGRERAERLRIQKEHDLAFGTGEIETAEISWDDFVQDHLQFCKARKSKGTCVIEERLLRQIGNALAPQNLSDLTYGGLEAFFTHRKLKDSVAPATLNKQIRTLRAILARAVERHYLKESPAKQLTFWREPDSSARVPIPDEVEKLLAAAPTSHWKAFIYLAAGCGLRVGEICNLRWEDIDLDGQLLQVRNRSHWQTKSRRNRKLGLSDRAVGLLTTLKRGANSAEYVFLTSKGNKWGNNIQHAFTAIVENGQVDPCTLHDLRRTFCTEVSKQVSPKVLKELAGHSDIKVTEKYYLASVEEEQAKDAANALPF